MIPLWKLKTRQASRPRRNPAKRGLDSSGHRLLRKPISGTVCCWATATTGHAMTPPTSPRSSRRLIIPLTLWKGILLAWISIRKYATECPLGWCRDFALRKRCPLAILKLKGTSQWAVVTFSVLRHSPHWDSPCYWGLQLANKKPWKTSSLAPGPKFPSMQRPRAARLVCGPVRIKTR